MSVELICRPLLTPWPKPETKPYARKATPFRVSHAVLWNDLGHELDHLKAREAVVEFDGAPADFRKADGRPFADARMKSPRVLLRFWLDGVGEIQYACDRYRDYLGNLRAISLTLTALRAVDRYETTTAREQYRGSKRLPPGGDATTPRLTVEDAAEVVAGIARMERAAILEDRELGQVAIRIAERRSHPDAGGETAAFQQVQEAKAALTAHWALAAGDAR